MVNRLIRGTRFSLFFVCAFIFSLSVSAKPAPKPKAVSSKSVAKAPVKATSAPKAMTAPKATPKTPEEAMLGRHMFALQWISGYGSAVFSLKDEGLYLEAKHEDKETGNFVTLKGKVKVIDDTTFTLTGDVVTRVHYLNEGNACSRNGTFEFKAMQNKKYYRLQPEQNPCDDAKDLIDVYVK